MSNVFHDSLQITAYKNTKRLKAHSITPLKCYKPPTHNTFLLIPILQCYYPHFHREFPIPHLHDHNCQAELHILKMFNIEIVVFV